MASQNNWKERANAANKSLMSLAEAIGVNYQKLYFASRGLTKQSPELTSKVEAILKAWKV